MGIQYVGTGRVQNAQTAAVSGTTATFTNAMSAGVMKMRLAATVDICFRYGKGTQTAVVTDTPVFAISPEYFTVMPGESVAVIARDGASTGTAYLSEVV